MMDGIKGIIDSHAHLDHPHYTDDRDAMLGRMRDSGVDGVICIGTRLSRRHAPQALAESADDIWFTAGVHPNYAHEEEDFDNLDAYRVAVDHPRCVGIGEAGLDYFHQHADPNRQMISFRAQLQVAQETGLPIVIHSREADEDMASTLEEFAARAPICGVMHCFSSGAELAKRALDIGFYISFSGILTFNRLDELRTIAAEIPDDRLLVETDAPYLSPEPVRKIKRNEPAHIVHTLKKLAEVKGKSVDEMVRLTAANTRHLFSKMEPKA